MDLIISALIFGAIAAATFFLGLKFFARRVEDNVLKKIRESFGDASMEALEKNSDQFLKLANEKMIQQTKSQAAELAGKKELIDSTLTQIRQEMDNVKNLINTFEKDREKKFGELTSGLKYHAEQTSRLQEITSGLNKVLSDTRQRGQWGERIAEDILNLLGMVENINYHRQKGMDGGRNRPDFTFLLPDDRVVNMDVKFPLDNFVKYVQADDDPNRESYKKMFIRDARASIKTVTAREYIDPDSNTLDFVIVFIPHEQGYAFLMQHDPTFLDDALKQKVIVCSPWTLYAFLAVIRQSIDNFRMERSARDVMTLMSSFYKQWENFLGAMEKVGKKIDDLQTEYGRLITTRRNQLEKPLEKIEQLHSALPDSTKEAGE